MIILFVDLQERAQLCTDNLALNTRLFINFVEHPNMTTYSESNSYWDTAFSNSMSSENFYKKELKFPQYINQTTSQYSFLFSQPKFIHSKNSRHGYNRPSHLRSFRACVSNVFDNISTMSRTARLRGKELISSILILILSRKGYSY